MGEEKGAVPKSDSSWHIAKVGQMICFLEVSAASSVIQAMRSLVKLDKRLGLKSEKCFLYFSLLYSKQVFDLSNLTLANFKQNEFSSSLVPFCLASLRSHTCWSLAERSRPSHPASPWIPALPAWVTAAVWPFGQLVIVHLSEAVRWGTVQDRQSTDAIHLFHHWFLLET